MRADTSSIDIYPCLTHLVLHVLCVIEFSLSCSLEPSCQTQAQGTSSSSCYSTCPLPLWSCSMACGPTVWGSSLMPSTCSLTALPCWLAWWLQWWQDGSPMSASFKAWQWVWGRGMHVDPTVISLRLFRGVMGDLRVWFQKG